MSDLSADELTVLLIAAKGEAMMPIGRWKAPIESLVAKGLLEQRGDIHSRYFNNFITKAGLAEAGRQDTIYDEALATMINDSNTIGREQAKARAHAEQIAVQLVDLATTSSQVTGDDKVEALRQWAKVILERALEMLGGR